MADNKQVIELYTQLAQDPSKDFGWDKGLQNAKAHGYKKEWIDAIPSKVWEFCAAVGNPFSDAEIKKGDTVLDLGCGAGVDVLVASLLVGPKGKVFGVDITPKMVEIATNHAKLSNASNVTILESSFEYVDLKDSSVDVVISNGAINLTSCKESVFAEIHRVLKDDGKIHFADMIDISQADESCSSENSSCSSSEDDWANCVAGTMREAELISLIQKAGFEDVVCRGRNHYATAKTTKGATFSAVKTASDKVRKKHWESTFGKVDYTQVLWHQNSPKKSLDLIKKYSKKDADIIDAGCGASYLVDELLKNGYENVTLLDTAKTSLDLVKKRIDAQNIDFIVQDVLNLEKENKFDVWHDRAVFHFLLTKEERDKYFEVLQKSLKPNAIAIISTFALEGPISCAGLSTIRYSEEKMLEALPQTLELVSSEEFTHITPKDSEQKYVYFIIRNRKNS